jgi:hypothetical protein
VDAGGHGVGQPAAEQGDRVIPGVGFVETLARVLGSQRGEVGGLHVTRVFIPAGVPDCGRRMDTAEWRA